MSRVIDNDLLDRIKHSSRCEWCSTPTPGGAEPNHIYARGMGGGSRLDVPINLLAMCHLCHRKWHDGNLTHADGRRVTRRDLFGIAAEREVFLLLRAA